MGGLRSLTIYVRQVQTVEFVDRIILELADAEKKEIVKVHRMKRSIAWLCMHCKSSTAISSRLLASLFGVFLTLIRTGQTNSLCR